MSVSTAYELNGRTHQKRRTRDALVAAAREIVAGGETPTVEAAAEMASISRATAYSYFPNQRALLVAAHPETAATSLLPEDAPDDVVSRLDLVMDAFLRQLRRERGASAHDAPPVPRGRPRRARPAPAAPGPSHPVVRGRARAPSRRDVSRPPSTGWPSPSEAPPGSSRWCGSSMSPGSRAKTPRRSCARTHERCCTRPSRTAARNHSDRDGDIVGDGTTARARDAMAEGEPHPRPGLRSSSPSDDPRSRMGSIVLNDRSGKRPRAGRRRA